MQLLRIAMQRIIQGTTLGIVVFILQGCTLAGASIGAGVDALVPGPYENRSPRVPIHMRCGDTVRVHRLDGTTVTGTYLGIRGPKPLDAETFLEFQVNGALQSVRQSELKGIEVEVAGKGWLWGGLVGLAVDTAVVVFVVYKMQHAPLRYTGPNSLN